jgi:hypothetical protein
MTSIPTRTARTEVDAFLTKIEKERAADSAAGGRLIFALDATASRESTWDMACKLQAEMFREAGSIGGLSVKLVYYRDFNECKASGWESRPERLGRLMECIDCRTGHTQICKVLAHALRETKAQKVHALVFVGDAVEEGLDDLGHAAGELGRLGVRAFMFQEGDDPEVEQAFREIARLTRGAHCRFNPGAAKQLAELLRAVAAFAVGGVKALSDRKDASAALLLEQMK